MRNIPSYQLSSYLEEKHLYSNNSINKIVTKSKISLKWELPPEGWYKLNIDGASKSNLGIAGFSGAIRNQKGEIIAAYVKNIGITTNNKAEVWAFMDIADENYKYHRRS